MNIETANRLLQYRKAHGLSQEELAEKIGVSRQAVSKWERAEASPDTDNLIILSEIYGVTLDDLLRGDSAAAEKPAEAEKEAPDDNTTYVKEERVNFKNGVKAESGGDKVDIGWHGIHVDAKDGSSVHIDRRGIHVHDGEKVRAYTDENGDVYVDEELTRKNHKRRVANMVPVWAFALIAFLAWGFSGAACGWALSWICFLAIPLYHSLVDAVYKRNPSHFAYPVLCLVFQMITGFLFGGWAWGWAAYLTIPIYYAFCSIFTKSGSKCDCDSE